MRRWLQQFLSSQTRGLHTAAYLLGFFTLLSQVLGLIRDRLFAATFGASHTLDIYYASFKIPDLILALGASVASIAVLVPILTRYFEDEVEKAKVFIDEIFTSFSVFIVTFCSVMYFLIPYGTSIVFPGFTDVAERNMLISLTRLLLFSPIILGISNIFASIAQVKNRFFVYALSPVLYNIGILIGILFLYPRFGFLGLGYGVILGALMHAGIHIPTLLSDNFLPRFRHVVHWQALRDVVLTSLPRAFTMSINQIVLIVLIGFASIASTGSITVFNFSYNLQSVPLAIIGVSYSLAAFPLLSRLIAQHKEKEFASRILYVALHILVLSIPVMALFIALRTYIVSLLFGVGAFGIESIRITSASLAFFALSLPAQSLQLLFIRAYYAAGMTKRPLLITVFGGGISMLAAYGFTNVFELYPSIGRLLALVIRVSDPALTQVLMLPLAYSIGLIISVALLWKMFKVDFKEYLPPMNSLKATLELISAGVGVGVITYVSLALLRLYALPTGHLITFIQACLASLVGIITGYLILKIFGNKPVGEMSLALRKRFSPRGATDEIIAPDHTEV